MGYNALYDNTIGSYCTAYGSQALYNNTTGSGNTAIGESALYSNATGVASIAVGPHALYRNTIDNYNIAIGSGALSAQTGEKNIVVGDNALLQLTTGTGNIAIGVDVGGKTKKGDRNIYIGSEHDVGGAAESRTIRLGGIQNRTFVAGISGVAVAEGVGVVIDARGQMGTVASSARFKEAIKPMDKASKAILALEPVTFRLRRSLTLKASRS